MDGVISTLPHVSRLWLKLSSKFPLLYNSHCTSSITSFFQQFWRESLGRDLTAYVLRQTTDDESGGYQLWYQMCACLDDFTIFAADMFLWRNKKISGTALAGATAVWVLFELLDYHLLTLLCHCLIIALGILFVWSNASTFINRTPPRIPEVSVPEKPIIEFTAAVRFEINRVFAALRDAATGRDLKKFLTVIAGLWVLSIVGSWCNFLTLFYIGFVVLHTVPVIYEKYEDHVDSFAEKAIAEMKKQYAVFDEKVVSKIMSKIPKGSLKDKKSA